MATAEMASAQMTPAEKSGHDKPALK